MSGAKSKRKGEARRDRRKVYVRPIDRDGEEWRPVTIDGGKYLDAYEVSNWGEVRRGPISKHGARPYHILSQSQDGGGYSQVGLYLAKKVTTTKVHRLVAEAFLGERPEGFTVNHIDGIKTNNSAANLEFVSNIENCRHRHRVIQKKMSFFGRTMSATEAAEALAPAGVNGKTVLRRIRRYGWTPEAAVTTPILPTGRRPRVR